MTAEASGDKSRTVEPPDVDVSADSDHVDTTDVDLSDVHADSERSDDVEPAPEPDDETVEGAKEQAEDLDNRYLPDARESVVLPGTDGTVSGTAIRDWLDDDGNIIHPDDRAGAT